MILQPYLLPIIQWYIEKYKVVIYIIVGVEYDMRVC